MLRHPTVAENQRIYIGIHKKKFANKSGVQETRRFPMVGKQTFYTETQISPISVWWVK